MRCSSVADVERLESTVKVYDNNNFALVPYINERTKEIVIQKEYQHYMPEFPRQWKRTSFYKEKLLKRKYMLPVAGITADFINAGFIRKIIFIEAGPVSQDAGLAISDGQKAVAQYDMKR